MSSFECLDHNTHLILLPSENTQPTCIALWAGTIQGEAKIIRVSLDPPPIQNNDLKERKVFHINGLPNEVSSSEIIILALAALKKAIILSDDIIYFKFTET
ncbi:MAG: hypothetical protein KDK44_01780 [Chlamydiia bacterium]|nr:hypothetical protein [Chlamydiia bacterium]MCP5510003.1 hypothetical protein [Chlamydiales bacterium]